MRNLFLFFYLIIFFSSCQGFGQKEVVFRDDKDIYISENLFILDDSLSLLTINEVISKKRQFVPYQEKQARPFTQWLYFKVQNSNTHDHLVKASLAFVDYIQFYVLLNDTIYHRKTGDLLPVQERNLKIGKMCLVDFRLPQKQSLECYLKLESTTDISRQLRAYSIKSVQLYSEDLFKERFETSRIYQAIFFGAMMMMLLYNLFLYSTIRSSSYLTYILFLLSLLIFIASNNGYIVELFLPDKPRIDLYIRFISAPVTLIAFLIFARQYLESSAYTPKLNVLISVFIAAFIFTLVLMLSGFWQSGRTLTVILSILSFLFIFFLAYVIMRLGYTPAGYFIFANFLLLAGAIFYSMERLNFVVQNPLTQYSIQLSVIFQSVFFSIGLADRIKLVQWQIANIEVEKEKLETLRQTERKNLTEEKNRALQASNKELDAFIYKTAHDIRGPVARLMGLSNVSLLDVKDPKAISYLYLFKSNSYYLNYLINRLYTSYEIRNKQIFKEYFNIETLIKERILEELRFNDDFNNMYFNFEIQKDLTIFSDLSLLKFILINLLENAIKFSDKSSGKPGTVNLRISVTDNIMSVNISDDGSGIKEEEVPYIFEMFSKAAGKYKSPGLGLYMSRLSIEKLGGSLTLLRFSSPTVFEMKLLL